MIEGIAYKENIDLDDSAARVLARLADGGMRDGLSLLDQCASATTGELTAERVYACLGIAGIQECGKLMEHIADHDAPKALALLNRFYADGKDMGALLDELACLTRDFMVLKTAPKEGIGMLSGVASDDEVKALSQRFSGGELVRMLGLIQQTAAGFVRSASRRMDVELCIVNLCQPDLSLDAEALNARLTRMEEQLKTGTITFKTQPVQVDEPEEELPPIPDDSDAPPVENEPAPMPVPQTPVGFWTDLAAEMRRELKPPVSGFFGSTANVRGELRGNKLVLVCANAFTAEVINKPDILQLVARKASAKLGTPIAALVEDATAKPANSDQMKQLLQFGAEHSDIINIKKN